MKALVVFESMFGNTEQVAEAVADGLRESMDVVVDEVSAATDPSATTVDLVVVGGPTHAFSLSRPTTRAEAVKKGATHGSQERGLREWLGDLERGRHRHVVAAFDTRAEKARHLPGSAARKATRLLRGDGYTSIGSESFYVQDLEGPLVPGELERATAWGRRLARSVGAPDPSPAN
jgi:hypothetical protein